MKQSDFELVSRHGHKLFAQSWAPDNEPKGVITLVHGFGEHCLRYTPYLEFFVADGYAIVGFDHYGHGQSDGKRGTVKSYNSLLNDIDLAVEKTKELFPNVPQFIYGHSMGGNLAMNYVIQRKPQIKGAVFTSPWLTLTKEVNFVAKGAASILQHIIPNFTMESGLDTKYISTSEEEVKKYVDDPLNHGRISMRLFYHITKSGIWAMLNADKIEIPALFMHGSADQITSPKATRLAATANTRLFDFVEWPDRYHELHNESIRPELAAKVMEWFKAKM